MYQRFGGRIPSIPKVKTGVKTGVIGGNTKQTDHHLFKLITSPSFNSLRWDDLHVIPSLSNQTLKLCFRLF
jgi:hypothetical protein